MNYNYLSQQNHAKHHQSPYNLLGTQSFLVNRVMCEFNVLLNGKTVFKDVVYAKTDEKGSVIVKNVLGETKQFPNCKIVEVDVNATKLVLTTK